MLLHILFLAYNSNSNEYTREKYRRKLKIFQEQCHWTHYLSQIMTHGYMEPNHMPKEFEGKINSFMSLDKIIHC